MKVRTFDMLTGEKVECDLVGLTISGLAKLVDPEGKTIVRKLSRCEYEKEELETWMGETV